MHIGIISRGSQCNIFRPLMKLYRPSIIFVITPCINFLHKAINNGWLSYFIYFAQVYFLSCSHPIEIQMSRKLRHFSHFSSPRARFKYRWEDTSARVIRIRACRLFRIRSHSWLLFSLSQGWRKWVRVTGIGGKEHEAVCRRRRPGSAAFISADSFNVRVSD